LFSFGYSILLLQTRTRGERGTQDEYPCDGDGCQLARHEHSTPRTNSCRIAWTPC
jgi:hypothetical protein